MDRSPRRPLPAAGVAALGGVAAAFAVLRPGAHHTLAVQALCLGAALAAVAWAATLPRREHDPGTPRFSLSATAALALLALFLRVTAQLRLPIPGRSGFEELQMGAGGWNLLLTGAAPLEFRFSTLLAAIGVAIGGPTIDGLRLPYQVMGAFGPLLLLLCLRELGTDVRVAAFLVAVSSTTRWLVIGSGAAYEDFSAMPFLLALLLCLVLTQSRPSRAPLWGALAGVAAGVLVFENSSYRFAILLGGLFLLSRARRDARAFALFAWTTALVAAPMLVNVARRGGKSVFFEAVRRYEREWTGLLPPDWLHNLVVSLRVLAGRPERVSFFLAPEGGTAVNPVLGPLLLASLAWALFRARAHVVRAWLAGGALFAILACSLLTSYFEAARLTPVLPLLILTLAVLLSDVQRLLVRFVPRHPAWPAEAGFVLYGILTVWVVASSSRRIERMRTNPDVRAEYRNNEYLIARHIALAAPPRADVLVYDPDAVRLWGPGSISHWVYAGRGLRVRQIPSLPEPGAILSGSFVVVGSEGEVLDEAELRELRRLAAATGSLGTWRELQTVEGKPVAASICVGCGGAPTAPAARLPSAGLS